MDMRATPSPYTPAGASNMSIGNPPVLGSQVPGTTGGLPALSGLSVTQNPMAQQLQSMGRGQDTMLVHMTPEEVNSLQGLAMASGGSLTINPETGLPEAGWLGKLLPTILGAVGAAFGVPTWALALGGAAGGTAITGDLRQGLMAGLGAWGGASLAGGLGLGKAGEAAIKAAEVGTDAATQLGGAAAEALPEVAANAPFGEAFASIGSPTVSTVAAPGAVDIAAINTPKGFLGKFASAASEDMPGFLGKYAPYVAGAGLLGSVSDAFQPKLPTYEPEKTKPYVRMAPAKREVRYPTPEEMQQMGSAEFNYFTPSNPDPVPATDTGMGYGFADGGSVDGDAGLDALISSYQAQSPGAITASMRPLPPPTPAPATTAAPTTTPAPTANTGLGSYTATPSQTGGETQYNFNRTPMGSTGGTGTGMGANIYIPGFGGIQLPDFSGMDFSQFMPQTQPPAPAPQPTAPPDIMDRFADLGFNNPQSIPSPMYRNPLVADAIARSQAAAPVAPAPDLSQFAPSPPEEYTPIYDIMVPGRYGRPNAARDMYAGGGTVNMRDGSFVVDARTVSELGNGSSNAGMELLARMGGRPIKGGGDGVSDSVPASIGGKQKARVARDEVIFQPEAVRRLGNGSAKRGTQKLYALMDKAHKARKKAKRGQDTKLRRGLA